MGIKVGLLVIFSLFTTSVAAFKDVLNKIYFSTDAPPLSSGKLRLSKQFVS